MWRASGRDIGAIAVTFGVFCISAVSARIYLARKRHLVLRSHDWLALVALLPVVALCVWDAIGALSHVLDFLPGVALAFSFHKNEVVNNRGLSAMMIIEVVASIAIFCSLAEFYQKTLRWKKDNPFVRFFAFFVSAGYGAALAYYISALIYIRAAIVTAFTVGIASLNLLVILTMIAVAVAFRSRLPIKQLSQPKLSGMYILVAFLVVCASVHVAYAAKYLIAYFDSDDYLTFAQLRENALLQNFYIADTTLWGLLTITMWIIVVCVPSFASEIQHLSNQQFHAQAWPQQAAWQDGDDRNGYSQQLRDDLYT